MSSPAPTAIETEPSPPISSNMDTTATTSTTNQPTPRLMITKMTLENFKSYAGKKEIGPFHKCFSSIVGPNGSGKSNVIDAMLFVFGKRAKKLRLNKVSELIHSSSQFKDKPLQYARVSVHFVDIVDTGDGDDDYEVLKGSEIVVSRVARRDNSSSYQLNGKNRKFADVATFLNSKGIDLDNNRFLILQGEVEMISMMPPKGRNENEEGMLEYLEDIIGSNKFLEETNEAAKKVETLTELRQERLNRVKAVEKEKENLSDAKQEAEALLGKEREIRRKKNILYQLNALEAREYYDECKSQQEESLKKLEEERGKMKEFTEKESGMETRISDETKEYNALHDQMVQTKKKFSAYQRKEIKMNEDMKHLKEKSKKLKTKIKNEKKKEEDSETKSQEAEESIPELEKKLEKLTESKTKEDAKLEEMMEEMKSKTQDLRSKLEKKTKELAPVEEERSLFQSELDTANTEVKLVTDATARAEKELKQVEKELSSLDGRQEKKRQELGKVEDELEECKGKLEEMRKEDGNMAEQEKILAKKNSELAYRVEEAKHTLESTASLSGTTAAILRATRPSQPLHKAGILGRLGDLATIPPKYDIAVSTAVGMLDHIVVRTTEGAKRAVSFLREHNIGRANFVALDKMKKGAHDRAVETPEGAPRLFDLIVPVGSVGAEVVPALYLAVRDTLVAKNLETASRLAFDYGKRWRVVTLDGNLIEPSGTMSGGGKSVMKGKMRLSKSSSARGSSGSEQNKSATTTATVTKEEVMQLEQNLAKISSDLQGLRKARRTLQDEIVKLERQIHVLTTRLPKLSLEINGYDTTRDELSKQLPSLRSQCNLSTEDTEKLASLKKKVEKCKSDMAACVMLASKLESEKAKLQKSIVDAGGDQMKKQKKKCSSVQKELESTTEALNTAKVDVKSCGNAAKKARKAWEAAEKELEKSEEVVEKKTEELEGNQEEAKVVKEEFEKAKQAEEEQKEVILSLEKELEEMKKSCSKMKCAEVELVAQLDGFKRSMRDSEKKLEKWEEEIERLVKADEQDDDYDVSDDEDEVEENDEDAEEKNEGNNDERMEGDNDEMKEDDVVMNEGDIEKNANVEGTENKVKNKVSKSKTHCLAQLPSSKLKQYDKDEIKQIISTLEGERDTLAKHANMAAIAEYRKTEAVYLARVSEFEDVSNQRNEARKTLDELRRNRLEMFMSGFGVITLKLKEMYQMITLGGDAELELVDSLDPFAEGIVFSVRPPKKSWKNIANLSGGEKTLSSLALVFALHHYKPTPLYVMDEIDAALDFKNVSIVANYIKERTKDAQFVIISLRNNMFELADRLVGIYKTNNCTKSITINPRKFAVGRACKMKEEVVKDDSKFGGKLSDKTNLVA